MFEKREIKGLWWVPGDDSNELSGTLSIDKGQVALETVGHFGRELISETETEKTYSHGLATRQRILGFSTKGKRITVEGDQGTNFTEHFPGMPVATYRRNNALIGKHFEDGEDIGFDEIKICASDLNAWTQINGFNHEYEVQEDKEKGFNTIPRMKIEFDAPNDIVIPLSRSDAAIIKFKAQSRGRGAFSEHVSLTQSAALHLRFARRRNLEDVYDYVSQVRNFLTLATGRPVSILSVTGFQNDYTEGSLNVPIPIELLWQIPHNPDPPEKTRHPRDMLFTLPHDTAEASKVMRSWFAKQKRLKPAFNLFFGARFHPDMYLEVRFLTYAQAIETYDYRRRSKPSDLHLAKRVSDILGTCHTVSKKIVGADPTDQDAFIKSFKDSRNYYTHYNPKLEERAAEGVALHLLTTQLQAILEMSLLKDLGFGCRSVDAIFERVRRYDNIRHFKSMVDAGAT